MNKTKDKSTNWKITEGKSKEYFMSQFNTGPNKIFFSEKQVFKLQSYIQNVITDTLTMFHINAQLSNIINFIITSRTTFIHH